MLLRGAFADACTVFILVCRHVHAVSEPHWLYNASVCNVKHLGPRLACLERACSGPAIWFFWYLTIYFHTPSMQLDVMHFPRQYAGEDVVFFAQVCG